MMEVITKSSVKRGESVAKGSVCIVRKKQKG